MRRLAVLMLPLAVVFVGCAGTALPRPGADREAEIAELKRRVVELERQARVNEIEIERLRRQLADGRTGERGTGERVETVERDLDPDPVERRIGPGGEAGGGSSVVEAPPGEPRPEEPSDQSGEVVVEEDELESLPAVETPAKRTSEEGSTPPAGRPTPDPGPRTPPIEQTRPVSGEAQDLYDAAYTAYHEGRYEDAEEGFRLFVESYPATDLSDNAQYWIGSARFARGDFEGAVAAFRTTVERYPSENKVPDALFKMGQALEELDRIAEAVEIYDEIVNRFPNAAAATLAAERREALR